MKRGTLYIVAAPSGAGKSSIVNAVLARDAEIALSISFTSRGARPGERHAQHYHFISAEEFEAMIRAGDFFEYARVHGDWKGTARQSVEPQLAAGKDVLLEHGGEGLYEPLDLKIARCRLMVAGHPERPSRSGRPRIATKFVNTTRRYFADRGRQVEVIKLYGSMELAPLVGLADYIVDVVDTGNTLQANGLAPLEHIADISSRLIVNKAAMKMKHARIKAIMARMAAAVTA